MTGEYARSTGADHSRVDDLSLAELDLVTGGEDPNYKECVLGTTAGGPPGLYPWYVECRTK